MGSLLVVAILAMSVLAIAGLVVGSVALNRQTNAAAGGVTLTGTQTLTNKTLTAPLVSRIASATAPQPTVAVASGADVASPTMAGAATDMTGYIFANGTAAGTPAAFSVTVTFNVPYSSTSPKVVFVNPIGTDIAKWGMPTVTWSSTAFTISYPTVGPSIPASGSRPFWNYLVIG